MIIVSQNKKLIVNFSNVTQVCISHSKDYKTNYYINFETMHGIYGELGEYETEERAKRVLQKMLNYCSSKVFYMPNR